MGDQSVRRRETPSRLVTGLALCCCASLALGQEVGRESSDSIVVSSRDELQGLRFLRWRGFLEITARREVDEVDQQNGDSQRDVEDRLEERLVLETEGFYIHPNLLEFTLGGGIRLRQERLDPEGDALDERNDEFLNEFDVDLSFLSRTDNPFSLYARRSENTINRQFGASLDNTITEYGARVQLRWKDAPTMLQVFHREQDQSGGDGAAEYDLVQDTLMWQTQLHLADRQDLTWDYTVDFVDESGSARRDDNYERHDALAVHTWEFGEDLTLPHRLRSEFRYLKETGLFATERMRLAESLDLQHSRTFQTRYDYSYEENERGGVSQRNQQASAGLRHQLFESLLTNADIGASRLEVTDTDFTSEERFGSVSFDYTKKVPLGEFNSGLTMRLSRQEDSEQGTDVQVLDQARSFDNSDRILFNRRNFIANSLVLTDLSGLIIYTAGLDYDVTVTGDLVEIRRILGGLIAPNQTVLLDYRIGPEPANTTDTVVYGVNARYDFQEGPMTGLGFYIRYTDQDQSRDTLAQGGLADNDVETLVYGTEYRYWRLYFQAEQESRDSTLSPFDATRLEARYLDRISATDAVLFGATYDRLEFQDVGSTSEITRIDGRFNTALTETLRLDLYAAWRDERNSQGDDLQSWEQEVGLSWDYRQTSVRATFRNVMNEGDVTDSTFQTFYVGFRREF
ncbi:MAG: hypothetical protein ACF8NJ_01770 [Phycisphaerales bacterium JB038]